MDQKCANDTKCQYNKDLNENLAWLTEKTEDPKSNKGNPPPPFHHKHTHKHTVNRIELQSNKKVATSPPNIWKFLPPFNNKGGGGEGQEGGFIVILLSKPEHGWILPKVPENAWISCSDYVRHLNMVQYSYNNIVIIVATVIILELLFAGFIHPVALLLFYFINPS